MSLLLKLLQWFLYPKRKEVSPPVKEDEFIPVDIPQDAADIPADDSTGVMPEKLIAPPPAVLLPPTLIPTVMWVLDPGHGRLTSGKHSPPLVELGGKPMYEWEFTRYIVRGVATRLEELGLKYYITVPEENVGNFLKGRTDRANGLKSTLPKVFVSVHSNAARAKSIDHFSHPSAKGIEVWHYHNSPVGATLAAIFLKSMADELGWVNRGVKESSSFYVLKHTDMPAILTESGFYNNREEVKKLIDPV